MRALLLLLRRPLRVLVAAATAPAVIIVIVHGSHASVVAVVIAMVGHARARREHHGDDGAERVAVGNRCAESNEHIHVGPAVFEGGVGGAVEPRADAKLHGGGQGYAEQRHDRQGPGKGAVRWQHVHVQAVVRGRVREEHHHHHERQGEERRHEELSPQVRDLLLDAPPAASSTASKEPPQPVGAARGDRGVVVKAREHREDPPRAEPVHCRVPRHVHAPRRALAHRRGRF